MMVGLVGQYTSGQSDSAALFVPLLIVGLLAFIPASIAGSKGYSKGAFWLFGLLLFIPALIVAAVIRPKAGYAQLSPAAAGASAPSSIVWTHSGKRYLLGYTVQNPYYGIWDRQVPGPPVVKYPYNDHGKSEALARYQEMEPRFEVIGEGNLPPVPPMPSTPPHDPGSRSADPS